MFPSTSDQELHDRCVAVRNRSNIAIQRSKDIMLLMNRQRIAADQQYQRLLSAREKINSVDTRALWTKPKNTNQIVDALSTPETRNLLVQLLTQRVQSKNGLIKS